MATCVACDAKGRVYVGDYMNDRIQVFDADWKHLKSIPAVKPAQLAIHHKTGDIYVFSWKCLNNRLFTSDQIKVEAAMTHLGPLEIPRSRPAARCHCKVTIPPFPGMCRAASSFASRWIGAEKPAVWIVNGKVSEVHWHDDGSIEDITLSFGGGCVRIYEEVDGKLASKRSFADDAEKSVQRLIPPILWRQRLYVNPASGKLYVAEGDSGVMKSVNQLVEIDPGSGRIKLVDLPLGAEDLCFDIDGLMYIRTDPLVTRYDPATWRVPLGDYGEQRLNHSFGMGAGGRFRLPASHARPPLVQFLAPGRAARVAEGPSRGRHLQRVGNGSDAPKFQRGEPHFNYVGKPYVPPSIPDACGGGEIHVWDKHGTLLIEDAVPGMGHLNGIGIDQDDNIYMLAASRRVIDGKPADLKLERDASGTVVKVAGRKATVLSSGGAAGIPIPLAEEEKPKRSQDLAGYTTGWVEVPDWFYGGVGFCTPGGCVCWTAASIGLLQPLVCPRAAAL